MSLFTGIVCLLGLSSWGLLLRWFPGVPNGSSECGGGGKKSKAAEHQADVARQREEKQTLLTQALGQLVPGSAEYAQLAATNVDSLSHDQVNSLGQQVVAKQQARVAEGGPATAVEARTNQAFQGVRQAAGLTPAEQDVLNALQGQATTTPTGQMFRQSFGTSPEQQAILSALRGESAGTPESSIYQNIVASALNPNQTYESTLQPQLKLALDAVQNRFAQRGLTNSGLELEGMGRAGVELAIQEAAARQAYRQQALENFQGLASTGLNIPQTQLGNLQSVYGLGQALRNRQIGVEDAYASLQQGRESKLTDLLGNQSSNATNYLQNLLQNRTNRANELSDVAYNQAQLNRSQLGGNLGAALSIALAVPTGGASLAAMPGFMALGKGLSGAQQPRYVGSTPTVYSSFLDQSRLANASAQNQGIFRGAGASNYPFLNDLYNNNPQQGNTASIASMLAKMLGNS